MDKNKDETEFLKKQNLISAHKSRMKKLVIQEEQFQQLEQAKQMLEVRKLEFETYFDFLQEELDDDKHTNFIANLVQKTNQKAIEE